MKEQLGGKEYISCLVGLGFEPIFVHFFYQLSAPNGGGGGGPMWWRGRGGGAMWRRAVGGGPMWWSAASKGGADNDVDWT
jgi:hypothetical protein